MDKKIGGVWENEQHRISLKLNPHSTIVSHFFAVREHAYELSRNDMQTGKLVFISHIINYNFIHLNTFENGKKIDIDKCYFSF